MVSVVKAEKPEPYLVPCDCMPGKTGWYHRSGGSLHEFNPLAPRQELATAWQYSHRIPTASTQQEGGQWQVYCHQDLTRPPVQLGKVGTLQEAMAVIELRYSQPGLFQ